MADIRDMKVATAAVLLDAIVTALGDYTDPASLETLANAYSLVSAAAPGTPKQASVVY